MICTGEIVSVAQANMYCDWVNPENLHIFVLFGSLSQRGWE